MMETRLAAQLTRLRAAPFFSLQYVTTRETQARERRNYTDFKRKGVLQAVYNITADHHDHLSRLRQSFLSRLAFIYLTIVKDAG